MNYTVLSSSGWQGDCWHFEKTFATRREAEQFIEANRTADPRNCRYNMRFKRHRKPLQFLDYGVYGFPDGLTVYETHQDYLERMRV